jgi:hypothetical protein
MRSHAAVTKEVACRSLVGERATGGRIGRLRCAVQPKGGPTLTHIPLPDSPLLGRVPIDACAELSAANSGHDQRGRDRPVGDASCDSGAVEVTLAAWCGWKTGRSPEPPEPAGWEC